MTAAEVGTTIQMRRSTAQRHLKSLARAGLVHRFEDERVWVYYNLTPAGRYLAENERPRLTLMWSAWLAIALLASAFSAWRAWKHWGPNGDAWSFHYVNLQHRFPVPWEFVAGVAVALVAYGFVIWFGVRRKRSASGQLTPSADADAE